MGITDELRVREDIFYGHSSKKILERNLNSKIENVLRNFLLIARPKRKRNLLKVFSTPRLERYGFQVNLKKEKIELGTDFFRMSILPSGEILSADCYNKDGAFLSSIQKLQILNLACLKDEDIISLILRMSVAVEETSKNYMDAKREIIRYKKARQISVNSIEPFILDKLRKTPVTSFSIELGIDSFKVIILGLISQVICIDAKYESFPEDLKDLDKHVNRIFQLWSEINEINTANNIRIRVEGKGKYIRNRQWIKLTDNGNIN